jgi:HPt (histidine-containing phosphotransfer) domain-containing protein
MLFITQGDEILKILEEHCIDGESKPWTEAAHKQKGASGMIGAGKLCNLCAQGQEMVNVSKKERKDLLAKISKEYKKVKEYLESEVL